MNSQSRIKLLQLRKFKKNFGFLSHYQGPILTKDRLNAKRESQNIKSVFLNDAARFNWVTPLEPGLPLVLESIAVRKIHQKSIES